MKKVYIILLISVLFSSCNKFDIPKCSFNDATQELPWLKEIIDERNANPTENMKYCYITQGKFKRKTVFIFYDCNPAINKIAFLIDCEGETISDKDGKPIDAANSKIKNQKIIWQPADFACNIN